MIKSKRSGQKNGPFTIGEENKNKCSPHHTRN